MLENKTEKNKPFTRNLLTEPFVNNSSFNIIVYRKQLSKN